MSHVFLPNVYLLFAINSSQSDHTFPSAAPRTHETLTVLAVVALVKGLGVENLQLPVHVVVCHVAVGNLGGVPGDQQLTRLVSHSLQVGGAGGICKGDKLPSDLLYTR